jgi:hypothetical protein
LSIIIISCLDGRDQRAVEADLVEETITIALSTEMEEMKEETGSREDEAD